MLLNKEHNCLLVYFQLLDHYFMKLWVRIVYSVHMHVVSCI